jgi:hypothetical protein
MLGVESDIGGLFATIALLEWSCKAEIYNIVKSKELGEKREKGLV